MKDRLLIRKPKRTADVIKPINKRNLFIQNLYFFLDKVVASGSGGIHNSRNMVPLFHIQGGPKKPDCFFRLDNFVTVSLRKAYSMSKFSQFYREKGTKLAFQ